MIYLRNITQASHERITQLLKKIMDGIHSTLSFYNFLYNKKEIEILKKSYYLLEKQLTQVMNNNYTKEKVLETLNLEEELKPLIFKTWQYEFNQGNEYISWFKKDKLGNIPPVVSVTFGDSEHFCNGRYGISYEVNLKGFLGAYPKDAGTVAEPKGRRSIYTIGENDTYVFNSYNLLTPIITPMQAMQKVFNDYPSKHNEIVLDSRFIKPIKVIYTNENDLDMVNLISNKYHLPIEYREERKK